MKSRLALLAVMAAALLLMFRAELHMAVDPVGYWTGLLHAAISSKSQDDFGIAVAGLGHAGRGSAVAGRVLLDAQEIADLPRYVDFMDALANVGPVVLPDLAPRLKTTKHYWLLTDVMGRLGEASLPHLRALVESSDPRGPAEGDFLERDTTAVGVIRRMGPRAVVELAKMHAEPKPWGPRADPLLRGLCRSLTSELERAGRQKKGVLGYAPDLASLRAEAKRIALKSARGADLAASVPHTCPLGKSSGEAYTVVRDKQLNFLGVECSVHPTYE